MVNRLNETCRAQVFRCPSLERRLAGLMHICGLVTLAERGPGAVTTNGSLPPAGESRTVAWATARAMEDWLVEVGFLEELFGSSMHVELVSLSCLIFFVGSY